MPNIELILLALDPSPIQQLLERALRAGGYTTSLAQDEQSLQKILLDVNPALMLIGESLKGESGFDISARVLERFPTLPVVMYAEKETPTLFKQGMRTGLSDILIPPLRIDEIIEGLKRSLLQAHNTGDWVRSEVKRNTTSLEKKVEELESLARLGRVITGSLDLDSVLGNVVTTAVTLTGAEEGSLLLVDEENGELYVRAERNLGEQQSRTLRLKVEDSLAGQVVRTGEPIYFSNTEPQKIKTAYLVQSLIYVPLRLQSKVIGVLGVDNRQGSQPFKDHFVPMLSLLADYASTAIHNTRLYQQTEDERKKLDTILENIDDGVIVLDEKDCVLYMNNRARHTFGLGLTGFEGQSLFELVPHPDIRSLFEKPVEDLLSPHEISFEDGRIFNARQADIPGIGSAITLQEITHLKMLDRLKNDFIHTVSHDLRSPLTSIMGYVELLDRIGPLNDQQKDFVRRVQNSVRDITNLINELLDLGRIESGFDTRRDVVAMDGVLRYTLDNYYNLIKDKSITLNVDVPEGILPVLGNSVRLRQVLDNLVGNAVKYTPNGGTITIQMQIQEWQLITAIKDTGVGIPQADQAHIFEKFYRASNTPKDVVGSGLGLAIVKSIVENYDGRVWVESRPNEGSTFFVVMPLYRSESGNFVKL